ncbi:unnamed protein product [Protopolystoma xenopodis]|uniref:Uncharacterized protein n=1 Tax=Protopolystoma xenopodis TaxID=117903 RepID=A0A448WBZ8_9PLAT|nr:unnamed protein product [Protopolystoma xenopodis]
MKVMAPLTDDADYNTGETYGHVPSQWCDAGNHEYYGRGHKTRYVSPGLPDAPTKLRKQDRTNSIILYAVLESPKGNSILTTHNYS